MLQQLRIPHVQRAGPTVIPGVGIYRVPIWFPQPSAVLDIDLEVDRLASGALCGAAALRRQQLRASGLEVHTLDVAAMRGAGHSHRLRAVAEAVAASCPEAAMWLRRADDSEKDAGASQQGPEST